MVEHGNNTFCQCAVKAFSNAILLGCCTDCVLVSDTMLLAPGFKLVALVLTTLVIPELLDLLSKLPLSLGDKSLENVEGVALTLEEVYLFEAREVVNEGDPV